MRTRDINAPLPGTYVYGDPASGVYPLGDHNPVDLYESSGLFKQNQVVINANARLNAKFSLLGILHMGRLRPIPTAVNTFPANSYDESNRVEPCAVRGAESFLYRRQHRLFRSRSIWPRPSPIRAESLQHHDRRRSERRRTEHDRPSYATSTDNPANVVQTAYGALNLRPLPGETDHPAQPGNGIFQPHHQPARQPYVGLRRTGGHERHKRDAALQHHGERGSSKPVERGESGTPVGVLSSPLFGEPQGLSEDRSRRGRSRDGRHAERESTTAIAVEVFVLAQRRIEDSQMPPPSFDHCIAEPPSLPTDVNYFFAPTELRSAYIASMNLSLVHGFAELE